MTMHITKTWIEDGKLITEIIPQEAVYKREWVGLTDEEVFDVWLNEMPAPDKVFYQKLCRSVEAKLKEKNGIGEKNLDVPKN